MTIVLVVWAVAVLFMVGAPAPLKRWLNSTPPAPSVVVYPPPVPPVTYLPQAEVDRRFAELVGLS